MASRGQRKIVRDIKYGDWRKVNEGEKGLVDSLLDGSIALTGNTSYLAQFVPAIERFYAAPQLHR